MAIALTNAYIDIERSTYSTTGGTTKPQPWLYAIPAFVHVLPEKILDAMPSGTVRAEYEMHVDSETDIRTGDVITKIIRSDTMTPWSLDQGTQIWRVLYAYESTPGVLSHRSLEVGRYIGGGPTPL